VLVTTVEPCGLCLAACHYAGIGRVVFGASLADMQAITGAEWCAGPPPGVSLQQDARAAECRALLSRWAAARRAPGA
jgi:tRNA(Arg) A34 adenosine deaminase TadA